MPGSEQRQPEPHFPTVLVSEALEVQRFKSDPKLNVSVLQPGVLILRPSPAVDCDSALTVRRRSASSVRPISSPSRRWNLEWLVIEWRPRRATRVIVHRQTSPKQRTQLLVARHPWAWTTKTERSRVRKLMPMAAPVHAPISPQRLKPAGVSALHTRAKSMPSLEAKRTIRLRLSRLGRNNAGRAAR